MALRQGGPILGGVAGGALRATAIEYGTSNATTPPPNKRGVLAWLFSRSSTSSMSGLGSATYDTAQHVVAALAAGNLESAIALMGAYDPQDIVVVGNKAIALGADPTLIHQIVASLAAGETITIVDTKPGVGTKRPWWHYALGLAVVGSGGYAAWRKWGR